ncbi:peptidoglycan DD-metalloendopeptidase family protein [candidate division KSB1 bacterium]
MGVIIRIKDRQLIPRGRSGRASLLLVISLAVWMGCASAPRFGPRPRYHQVKAGETLWRIARTYGVSVEAIRRANKLTDDNLRVGLVLTIPGSQALRPVGIDTPPPAAAGAWIWPVAGIQPERVTSFFGLRRGSFHSGLDIAGSNGDQILAARSGVVIFNGRRDDYGWTLILQHRGRYNSLYAHNSGNMVSVGAKVAAGQPIARMGRTGRATGTHLHFEVRYRGQPIDPLTVLPDPE